MATSLAKNLNPLIALGYDRESNQLQLAAEVQSRLNSFISDAQEACQAYPRAYANVQQTTYDPADHSVLVDVTTIESQKNALSAISSLITRAKSERSLLSLYSTSGATTTTRAHVLSFQSMVGKVTLRLMDDFSLEVVSIDLYDHSTHDLSRWIGDWHTGSTPARVYTALGSFYIRESDATPQVAASGHLYVLMGSLDNTDLTLATKVTTVYMVKYHVIEGDRTAETDNYNTLETVTTSDVALYTIDVAGITPIAIVDGSHSFLDLICLGETILGRAPDSSLNIGTYNNGQAVAQYMAAVKCLDYAISGTNNSLYWPKGTTNTSQNTANSYRIGGAVSARILDAPQDSSVTTITTLPFSNIPFCAHWTDDDFEEYQSGGSAALSDAVYRANSFYNAWIAEAEGIINSVV